MVKCKCGREFEKQISLSAHGRTCKLFEKKIFKSNYKLDNGKYKCECGKEFKNHQALNGHFGYCVIHRNGKKIITNRNKNNENAWNRGKTYETLMGFEDAKKYKQKLRNANKGNEVSIETRKRLSKARIKQLENNPHIKWFSVFNGETKIKVQGEWEKNVAEWLTENKLKWIRKRLKFDTVRTYTPDFFLPELNIYIEVKGWMRKADLEKYKKVLIEHDIDLRLIEKKDYKKLSSLDPLKLPLFKERY